MSEQVTDEDIVTRIDGEINEALGYGDELSEQRYEAMKYYYSEPFGNEVEGRSQYVDSTVQDTIEWIKPSLMRVFASGDELVQFEPNSPAEVDMAKQATDYVNYVLQRQHNGWEILYQWFTDALLQKNGIVKVWWDDYDEYVREEYRNLSDVEFEALVVDEDVEIVEHSEYPVEGGYYHDCVVKRMQYNGQVYIENIPPEEFLINREAKTIEDARFICHRIKKTLSELRQMYPDIDPNDLKGGDIGNPMWSTERQARYSFDSTEDFWNTDSVAAPEESMTEYWLYESFIRTDYDGDGIAELRKVCTVGTTILANDEIDNMPFISLTPIKIPHKFFGLSVADLVMPLQKIKSTLIRNLLDNMYNQNYGRFAVLEGQANLDDLLTARPGGIVRVKSPNAVTPLATPSLEPFAFNMVQYMDQVGEARAGVSATSQGLNDKALTSHTTASAVNAVMTAAQSRVELIARQFAETGVKDLMCRIYELLVKNMDRKRVVKLRREWIEVDPRSWADRMDATVSVALGHGNKDQQVMQLTQLVNMAADASGTGLVSPENMYNLTASLLKSMGYQNVDDYITPPDRQPQPQPDPMKEATLEAIKVDTAVKQGELEVKRMKAETDANEAKMDAKFKMAELAMENEQERSVKLG
jgi:hypothetical protein